ncbi:MAG: hypothetical protein KDK39_00795 [Leptospiraceae bacterium]|nr:hypothetical protein [Leptospiraceae bacterium]
MICILLLALYLVWQWGWVSIRTNHRSDPGTEERGELVEPGEIQADETVPGEDNIRPSNREILLYTNELARRNGFQALGDLNLATQLKNPDLVFPGDILRLPDNRVVRIEPQGYIWDIARQHYKKDRARLVILKNRYSQTDPGNVTERSRLRAMMMRLAVTPGMLDLVEE